MGYTKCIFHNIPNSYAKNFKISKSVTAFKLEIKGERAVYLYNKNKPVCGQGTYLHIPIDKIAIFSTTYIGFLQRLKAIHNIGFLSSLKYVYSKNQKNMFTKNGGQCPIFIVKILLS